MKMKIAEINKLLSSSFEEIYNRVQHKEVEKQENTPDENKWTIGQHIYLLFQPNKTLYRRLKLSGFIKRYQFELYNKACRNYQTIVSNYQTKLYHIPCVTMAPISVNMDSVSLRKKELLLKQFNLVPEKVKKISEKHLEHLLLHHPLEGRRTLIKLLIWNAYHKLHNLNVLKKNTLT